MNILIYMEIKETDNRRAAFSIPVIERYKNVLSQEGYDVSILIHTMGEYRSGWSKDYCAMLRRKCGAILSTAGRRDKARWSELGRTYGMRTEPGRIVVLPFGYAVNDETIIKLAESKAKGGAYVQGYASDGISAAKADRVYTLPPKLFASGKYKGSQIKSGVAVSLEEVEGGKPVTDKQINLINMAQAGRRDRLISVYEITTTKGDTGQEVKSITQRGTKWANVRERRGNETVEADKHVPEYTHRFQVDFDKIIEQTDIIHYAGDWFEIKSLNELGRKETLEIYAQQRNDLISQFTEIT